MSTKPGDVTATCGAGLAEQAALPAQLGELTAALAEVLDLHVTALDVSDPSNEAERAAYVQLTQEFEDIASRLRATANRMRGYRDLPMGRHDEKAMSGPNFRAAFERFVRSKQELLALLQQSLLQDQEMLARMPSPANPDGADV